MTHPVGGGVRARLEFEGDVFETEDQRNWTDASFKTYCTPLAEPFPVPVEEGDTVEQAVTVQLRGKEGEKSAGPVLLEGSEEPRPRPWEVLSPPSDTDFAPLPALGVELKEPAGLDATRQERLDRLGLDHLRLEVHPANDGWAERFRRGVQRARDLGVDLEVPLFLTEEAEAELEAVSDLLDEVDPPLARVLVLHEEEKVPDDRWTTLARRVLAPHLGEADFVSGTDCFFTELNRDRPDPDPLDGVCYSLNPQVHAFDNRSLVETLQAQPETVRSARRFADGRPVIVSPVTLKPRFNPNATESEPEPEPGELPDSVDPRQMSLFAAAWTTGSLRALSATGPSALTYYEAVGWRGLMEASDGSPLPDKFPPVDGGVFPLYHVLGDVAAFAGGEILPLHSSRPLAVAGFALRKDGAHRILVANLTDDVQVVEVEGPTSPSRVRVRMLDETTAEAALREPAAFRERSGQLREADAGGLRLSLLPYSVSRIDLVSEK